MNFEWSGAPVTELVPPYLVFEVLLRRTGMRLKIPQDQSILETLEANGVEVPFACREWLCRSCVTPLCAGEAEHLDHVLSDAERATQKLLLICVSRARTPVLELDI